MIIVVDIKRLDEKWEKHECVDFPSFGTDFVTLFKDKGRREMIRTVSVIECNYYPQWQTTKE